MSFVRSLPLLLLLVPAVASAQSMNAQTFYARAEALKKKGPMAIFSGGEIKALMAEGKAAGKQNAMNRTAAIKAGAKPRYCPPTERVQMKSSDFMVELGKIPLAERSRIDMTEAMTRILAAKYPCAR